MCRQKLQLLLPCACEISTTFPKRRQGPLQCVLQRINYSHHYSLRCFQKGAISANKGPSPLLKVEIPTKEGGGILQFPFICTSPPPYPPLSSRHKGWWELKGGGNIFNFYSKNQPSSNDIVPKTDKLINPSWRLPESFDVYWDCLIKHSFNIRRLIPDLDKLMQKAVLFIYPGNSQMAQILQ